MQTSEERITETNRDKTRSIVWRIAIVLLFIGLFVLPMHLRVPFIKAAFPSLHQFSQVNVFALAACGMLVITQRKRSLPEKILYVLWILLLIPVLYSDRNMRVRQCIPAIFNCILPVFLICQEMEKSDRRKLLRAFLTAYNVFAIALLALGIYEKVTDGSAITALIQWYTAHGYNPKELIFYQGKMVNESFRFFSPWGHAQTNCIFFNAFFILNDIYYRSVHKRYPKLLFFLTALTGCLLCVGKAGILVLCAYTIVSLWKDKLWLLIYVGIFAAAYLLGLFGNMIQRFSYSLTSGRAEGFKAYLDSGSYPFRIFSGYGYNAGSRLLSQFRGAFEAPLAANAINYGILFSVLFLGSIFLWFTVFMLRRKQIACWLGTCLLFLEFNTNFGICRQNHDLAILMFTFIMLMVNAAAMAAGIPAPQQEESEKHSLLSRILCSD